MVLGLSFPSLRNLSVPQDWTRFDDSEELAIRLRLREPLHYVDKKRDAHGIHGFELTCKPYKVRTKRALPGDSHLEFRVAGNDDPAR